MRWSSHGHEKPAEMENYMDLERVSPEEIERRSFEIITRELGDRVLDPQQAPVIKRVIHATADFDYVDNLVFSPGAVELALEALRQGAPIVTDTNMGKAGINKKRLERFGNALYCFMAEPETAKEAKERGITRASASMDMAARLGLHGIFAIGNAPTALIRLHELTQEGILRPKLIIGVPVGFVNVIQAKELILKGKVPYIVARGRKGGSNVAAAVCNALLLQMHA